MENKHPINIWNKYYAKGRKIQIKPKNGFFSSYDIFLCDNILAECLPFNKGDRKKIKICEIGCGDGKLLKKIADNFNYEPFGIEYSIKAIEQAKRTGIKVIKGDVFNKDVLNKYKEYFDIVYSYGFIEHIVPPEKVIDVHLHILKKGGYFFVQIPRLKGFNYLKVKIFQPNLLPLHNFKIMEEKALRSLCKKENVEELFCKNYGTIKLRVPMFQKDIRWCILKSICIIEYFLNPICRLFFKKKGFETKLFSPCVMFVGRKI